MKKKMNYSELIYNDISKYNDTSDKDFLNYESDYHIKEKIIEMMNVYSMKMIIIIND